MESVRGDSISGSVVGGVGVVTTVRGADWVDGLNGPAELGWVDMVGSGSGLGGVVVG